MGVGELQFGNEYERSHRDYSDERSPQNMGGERTGSSSRGRLPHRYLTFPKSCSLVIDGLILFFVFVFVFFSFVVNELSLCHLLRRFV